MQDINVNWKIISSRNNDIIVEYSYANITPITVFVTGLHYSDFNNIDDVIIKYAPYTYFAKQLYPDEFPDTSILVGQEGTVTIKDNV